MLQEARLRPPVDAAAHVSPEACEGAELFPHASPKPFPCCLALKESGLPTE